VHVGGVTPPETHIPLGGPVPTYDVAMITLFDPALIVGTTTGSPTMLSFVVLPCVPA
jgi:hypothetical protein